VIVKGCQVGRDTKMSDFSLGILGLSIRSYLFMYTRVNRVYKRDLDHVLEE